MGISVGVSTGEGTGEGSGVFVATGGVYSAVCVPKNEATMVPTPEVKTKSTSVVGATSELPPQAVSKIANKNRHKFCLTEITRSSNFSFYQTICDSCRSAPLSGETFRKLNNK